MNLINLLQLLIQGLQRFERFLFMVVYNNGRPLTYDEMVERLQEDNRMTDDEIHEYLGSFDE